MTTNCIIVHWCPDSPADDSYDKKRMSRVQKQLTSQWIPTIKPRFPSPWSPSYEHHKEIMDWLAVSDDTTLIWHSCGCAFLIRRLWETQTKIDKLILVAPRIIADQDCPTKKAFYEFPLDKRITKNIWSIIFFTSDTEALDGKESLRIIYDTLWWTVITIPNYGHYTTESMWTDVFSELINVILPT